MNHVYLQSLVSDLSCPPFCPRQRVGSFFWGCLVPSQMIFFGKCIRVAEQPPSEAPILLMEWLLLGFSWCPWRKPISLQCAGICHFIPSKSDVICCSNKAPHQSNSPANQNLGRCLGGCQCIHSMYIYIYTHTCFHLLGMNCWCMDLFRPASKSCPSCPAGSCSLDSAMPTKLVGYSVVIFIVDP